MVPIDRTNDVLALESNKNVESTPSVSLTYSTIDRNQVLSTATIFIEDRLGRWLKCNALLDCGSQSNLITEELCNKLNLTCQKIDLSLSGISQLVTKISNRTQTRIKSRISEFEASLSFLVLPVLTEKLPLQKFDKSLIQIPSGIKLADEQFNEPKQVDVLLGAEIFYSLLESGKVKLGNGLPILQETALGWVISGNLSFSLFEARQNTVCNFSTRISNQGLNDLLTKFWKIGEFENSKFLSNEENYCEEYFK